MPNVKINNHKHYEKAIPKQRKLRLSWSVRMNKALDKIYKEERYRKIREIDKNRKNNASIFSEARA